MKRLILVMVLCVLVSLSFASEKKYEPTWESLDSRQTPQWYPDAKFGIFIHWGLYSVPSFAVRGTYAEWYWHNKEGSRANHAAAVDKTGATNKFHNRVYGKDFQYFDFREMFTCEMFEPDHWANVFKRSGAKYVVLTSKHHDGYCLWPSSEASESFGMAWNSVDSGPKRDLVGDLTKAVREEGLKMGLYYSIWDWFNPYWSEMDQPFGGRKYLNEKTRDKYIHEVMYPQFKDIVMNYQPSLIFSDGDWWMDDNGWQTRPLLAWLFNQAPNKDEVVINDRWGKVRGKHGGYFTTEYGSGFEDPDVLWEENRGIGKSFGYNRVETYDDYNSEKLLIFMLVDIVSRGGNLLLDIGPTADGRIPVIMEDRLIRMGDWLKVNGEAIYGSRRWKTDCQWSDGKMIKYTKQDFHHGDPNPILEMSVIPRPGQAVKQCYFTAKGDILYAMLPVWPDDGKFTIRDVDVSEQTKITMLGFDGELKFSCVNDEVQVKLPRFSANQVQNNYIYTLKLTEVK